jgi:polar amino acid transport system substrate-binding protein
MLRLMKQLSIILIVGCFASSVASKQKLRCATNEFAPYGYLTGNTDKELIGIEVDVFNEIMQRLNIDSTLVYMPWKRMLLTMRGSEIDCMFAAFKTAEREKYMDYTTVPLHVSSLTFFKEKGTNINYEKLSDLKERKLTFVRGFKSTPELDAMINNKEIFLHEVNDFAEALTMLSLLRTDLVLVNSIVGKYTIKKHNLQDKLVMLPVPLKANSAYITFIKKHRQSKLVEKVDSVLFEIFTDGTYKKLADKYLK